MLLLLTYIPSKVKKAKETSPDEGLLVPSQTGKSQTHFTRYIPATYDINPRIVGRPTPFAMFVAYLSLLLSRSMKSPRPVIFILVDGLRFRWQVTYKILILNMIRENVGFLWLRPIFVLFPWVHSELIFALLRLPQQRVARDPVQSLVRRFEKFSCCWISQASVAPICIAIL